VAVIVYVPLVVPELFVTDPVALRDPLKSEMFPVALNVQLLLSVYEPERLRVAPPIDNEPVPVRPALGLHDMVSELTDIPVATVTVFMVIVYEPVVEPEDFVTVPVAVTVVPKSVIDPLALKVQLLLSV